MWLFSWFMLLVFSTLSLAQTSQSCESDANCGFGQFCAMPFGTCASPGECVTVPGSYSCDSSIVSTICGCDGKTYKNLCLAYQNKVSGLLQDTCPVGVQNDCLTNSDCGEGAFCNIASRNCTGVGQCAPIPKNCPSLVEPVCGCDAIVSHNYSLIMSVFFVCVQTFLISCI
eukprot:TRINITY_DN1242_c0_g1_i5.p1 TRINITY_DN1242_c0_g1~~TRINITY_DN1242_c0_g1_i5.p1  ORF type:complete len:171 (-),score=10.08 TRINITY_DN1242_c0_g1_i5:564-1076(-)